MRLLHFADLHLGIENYGTLDVRTGLSTRVQDFLHTFDEVVDYAIREEVDAVLFAGDAFKNRDPNPTLQREFADRIRRLAQAGLPTVLLIGNHDLPTITARATAIDIYEALEIPNIHVSRRPGLLTILTKSGPLQVATLPWISRSLFLKRDEYRKLSTEEFQRRMAEAIAGTLEAATQRIDPACPAVLLAHVSLEGAKLSSEQSIMLGNDVVVGTEELAAKAFDYVALGHIHQHQAISAHPPTVYAGSLERIDFGEEKDTKGFVTVDIGQGSADERSVAWTFHPVQARPFLTLRVIARNEDPLEDVRRAIERQARDIAGAIVRAFIQLPAEREELLRIDEVRRLLHDAGAIYVAKIVREVDLQSRPRVDIRDEEALDPVIMLERWLGLRELSLEQRQKILEYGKEIIRTGQATE